MPITSISRDTNNNVCLVRMISSDTFATVTSTDYILNENDNITALNGGTWEWFFSDMILCKCSDQVVLLVFRGSDFNTVSSYAEQGGGTVNPGLQNQLAYYATNGSNISGLATANNGVLVTSGIGAPSIASTLPFAVQSNITRLGTITSGVWQGNDITVPFGGTGNTTFTAYSVICAGTTATGAFQNVSGVGSSGQVLTSNGAGSLPTWQASAGSGTVSPGLQNQIAYYAADGSTVSGLTGGNSGVLITSGLGVPSISSTLPLTVQTNITELGTITVGTWHGSVIAGTYGGTGVNNGASTITIGGNVTFSGAFTFTGTLTGNTSVTFPTSGTLATTSQIPTGAALTKTDDTNVTLTLGGSPSTALVNAASLTLGWTGQLSVGRGGTGTGSLTAHNLLIGNGTSAVTLLAPSATSGAPLLSQGAAADPAYGAFALSLGGTLTTAGAHTLSGAFASTFTFTNTTSVTFPTSGTLATTSQIPTGAALTKTDDTNVTLTLGGSPSTALVNAASLTLGWTGTLSGTRGGTGVNNGSNTATFAGNLNFANSFTTSGNFAVTQTYTGVTNVTFPTSGTLATTSQLVTPAALTKTDDTNVTLTLGGSPSTALVNAASLTLGWTGQLGLTRGGTNASLTASNGGIIYSTASALAVLAGTATANQVLLSGSSTTPAWSTATYPATTTINQILYSSAANTISGLATANNSVLATNGSGVPSLTTSLPSAVQVGVNSLNSGTSASSSTFWRGDGTWAAPAGSGTVNSGLINQLAWYSAAGTAVSGLTTANNGILVTSSGGVPSIGNTVGAGLTMPSITFNSTTGVVGTTTNDNAAAGSVGEYVSSQITYGSPVSVTNGVLKNLTSISLTAGDWDVWGNFGVNATTAVSSLYAGISTTSATLPDNSLTSYVAGVATSTAQSVPVVQQRLSLSGTTTVYLVQQSSFTGTGTAWGLLAARRRR